MRHRNPSWPFHRPSAATQGAADYAYHATNEERAYDIAQSGLKTHQPWEYTDQSTWPDGATGKRIYFSDQPHVVWQFAPEEGEPVLLRVSKAAVPLRRESTGDLYATRPIAPDRIEIRDADGNWHPVTELQAENPHRVRCRRRTVSFTEVQPMFWPRNPSRRRGNPSFAGELKWLHGVLRRLQDADDDMAAVWAGEQARSTVDRLARQYGGRRGELSAVVGSLQEPVAEAHEAAAGGDLREAAKAAEDGQLVIENFFGGLAVRTNPRGGTTMRKRRNPDTLFTLVLVAAALVGGVVLQRYGAIDALLPDDWEDKIFPPLPSGNTGTAGTT